MIRKHGGCPPPCLCSPATNTKLQGTYGTYLPEYAHLKNYTDIIFCTHQKNRDSAQMGLTARPRVPRKQITAAAPVLLPPLASRGQPVGLQPREPGIPPVSLTIKPVLTPDPTDLQSRLWSLPPRASPPPSHSSCQRQVWNLCLCTFL